MGMFQEGVCRRRCERVLGKIQAKLLPEAAGQRSPFYLGFITDISLQGVSMAFLRLPPRIKTGDRVIVEMGGLAGQQCACIIVRMDEKSVGLAAELAPSEFAQILSLLFFSESQYRLGVDLAPRERRKIIVQTDDGAFLEACLDKISTSQLECTVCETASSLAIGQAVTVNIPSSDTAIHSPGVVRTIGATLPHYSRISVLFSSMPKEILAEIKALVAHYYRDRFDRLTCCADDLLGNHVMQI